MISSGVSLFVLIACSFAPVDDHVLDPDEQAADTAAPAAPDVDSVALVRNPSQGNGCGMSDSCDGSGQIGLVIAAAADDRTPLAEMGYRIEVIGGTAPANLGLPDGPVRADASGTIWLLFSDDDQDLDVTFAVRAVDLAGNAGPPTPVEVVDERGGCAAAAPIAGRWGAVLVAVLAVLFAGRRRNRDIRVAL